MNRAMPLLSVLLLLSYLSSPCRAQESRWASPDEPMVKQMVAMEAKWASSSQASRRS